MSHRIPLFPLNVVLFPGMPLPLHIFEPRYQEMVRHCMEGDRMFGVCLIRDGQEVGGPADPYPVGTTCEIVTLTPLDQGRMNLMTVGRHRFQVIRLFTDRPYLEAEVELLPDERTGDPGELPARVSAAAAELVNALLRDSGQPERALKMPDDPRVLSYVVGALLPSPLPVRQELLELDDVGARLQRQLSLLEEALTAAREAAGASEEQAGSDTNANLAAVPLRFDPERFSLN